MGLGDVRGADAPIIQPARHGPALAVDDGVTLNTAHVRDADDDAGAVGVAQTALHIHGGILFRTDGIGGGYVRVQRFQLRQKIDVRGIEIHKRYRSFLQ